MSYIINKTDGSILATVADGQIDQNASDITLIGKNYSGFGEALNENFVKLLENFADVAEPPNPIKGQLWFDSSESKLKVFSGTSFVPVSSATIASSQPSTLGVGDLWFDDVAKQLYFYDGTNTILLGPSYSASQGLSGFKVTNVLDDANQNRVVTLLYTNGILLGIFSKDDFDPKLDIPGFGKSHIYPGFNKSQLAGIKFDVTCTNSESLGNQPAASYLRKDTDNIMAGQLTVTSNRGILVGDAQQAQISVVSGNVQILNDSENRNIVIKVKRGGTVDNVISVDTVNQELDLYRSNPDSTVSVGGDLTVYGNLIVQGDTTTVNAATLTIEDKNIELAKQEGVEPTDENANGGGIILKGDTDHSILWNRDEAAWESTEHIVLETNRELQIKDPMGIPRTVITWNSLGDTIKNLPGVTSFGTQTIIQVGPAPDPESEPVPYLKLQNNKISSVQTNQDIEIEPNGTGDVVLVGNPHITGLADPPTGSGYEQYAATREYVDRNLKTKNLVLSMDVSDGITNTAIAFYLTQIAPPAEYRNGVIARILCTSVSNNSTTVNMNSYLTTHSTEFITPISPSTPTPGGTAFGIDNVSFNTTTIPAQAVSVTRVVKEFQLTGGVWTPI